VSVRCQAEAVCELDATDARNLLLVKKQSLDAMNACCQQIVRELASARGDEL
jgi:hypothetical protein